MNVSPDGGTVKIDRTVPTSYPATTVFPSGESVYLEAVPAPSYRFTNWSGDLSDNTNPTTLKMDCNKNITANFFQVGAPQVSRMIITRVVNWPMVAGIIVGLLLLGVLIADLIRRRAS